MLPSGSRKIALLVLAAVSSVAMNATQSQAGEPFVPLTIGGHQVVWRPNGPGVGVTLRYKVANRDIRQPSAVNCRALRAPRRMLKSSGLSLSEFQAALRAAALRWSAVANVRFMEVAPDEPAEITVGEQVDPVGHAFTNLDLGERADDGKRRIMSGTICLNAEKRWKIGFDGNLAVFDLVHTLTHELGHVIGLDHPSARGHLMSFRYLEDVVGLSIGDAKGAAALYGEIPGSNSAATTGSIGLDTEPRSRRPAVSYARSLQ